MNRPSRPQPRIRTHRALRARPFAILAATTILSLIAQTARSVTAITGDVTPLLPWSASTDPHIGDAGVGSLTVDAGSELNSRTAFLGFSSGASGSAIVTGTGSEWASRSLFVGHAGSGSLTVEDGGRVTADTLFASLDDLYGDGTIEANGAVVDADLQFHAAGSGQAVVGFGSGGTLTVTAAGGILGAGYKGEGSLTITEGVAVVGYAGFLGYSSESTGLATVSGAGTQWTNSRDFYVGRKGSGTLRVEAGGQVASHGDDYIGYQAGSTGTATVTDAGSQWTTRGALFVGRDGNGSLRVEEGGQVTSDASRVGFTSGATGEVIVSGDGSQWTSGRFSASVIGGDGSGSLRVEAGGLVSSSGGVVGGNSGATGEATITGLGSQWNSGSVLSIGFNGKGSLLVEAGGLVTSTAGYLGRNSGSTGAATITGAGSQWNTYSDKLVIGQSGNGTLRVESGGQVRSGDGYIGWLAGSRGDVIVAGAGSQWNNSGSLILGQNGQASLTVTDGGHVTANRLYASISDVHGNGTITVVDGAVLDADIRFDSAHAAQSIVGFGAGGMLIIETPAGELGAGYKGQGSLTVAEGVTIVSEIGYLGYSAGSMGEATIAGAGSQWKISDGSARSEFYVGRSGNGTLRVEAGGQVISEGRTYVGYQPGATGSATIIGPGSQWNGYDLLVGSAGSGSLRVDAGGLVTSHSVLIGNSSGATGKATITGVGSQWITSDLDVSGGASLRVEAGGQLISVAGCLGGSFSDAMGRVTVIGDGSQWTIDENLIVGDRGAGLLRVEAGGQVNNNHGALGSYSGAFGEATITGAGSQWNVETFSVGNHGSGILNIANRGLVRVRVGLPTIDYDGDGDSFINMAAGGMLALGYDVADSLSEFLGRVRGSDAIRYWDADAGAMALLTAATYGDDYTLEYLTTGDLAGYTLLTVTAAGPPGDYNGDFVVDGNDLLAWQRGDSPDPHSAADLADWQANYGWSAQPPANSAAVPEPAAAALAIFSCLALRLRCG